jgi:hypothetical protein
MRALIGKAQFTIDVIEVSDLITKLCVEITRLKSIDGSPELVNDLIYIKSALTNRVHIPSSSEICEIDTILMKSRRLNK